MLDFSVPPPRDVRIEAALATRDDDRRWQLVGVIALAAPEDVLAAARDLLGGRTPTERALGADVIGQLVTVAPETKDRALAEILPSVRAEIEPGPLASVVTALGHIGDPAAIDLIVGLVDHAYPAVRLGVAWALASIDPGMPRQDVVTALIRLSRDPDAEVRDWATFGLGTLSHADGSDVREALLARAEDAYPEARAEALFGLVLRSEPRVVPALIRALESPLVGHLELDAAAEAGDPRLLPALRSLERTGRAERRRLRRAIERCSAGHQLV